MVKEEIMLSSQILSPTRTIVSSFTPRRPIENQRHNNSDDSSSFITEYDDGDWVLCLASSYHSIACALSNGCIQIYDATKLLPIFSTQYFPHQKNNGNPTKVEKCDVSSSQDSNSSIVVTDLIYGPENTIISTSSNGVVIVSDLRVPTGSSSSTATATPNPVVRGWIPESALCLSLGYDQYCVAIGTNKGRIRFIDLRKAGEILGSYVNSHTDAVTQVKFNNSNLLLSGSEDGLMYLFDTKQPTEELATQSIMNVSTSIRKIGFCQQQSSTTPFVYCLTGSETMSIWDTNTTSCQHHFDHWNLRQNLTNEMHSCVSSMPSSTTTTQISNETIDYLIDAYWDDSTHELQLAAGTNNGDVALFTCTENSTQLMNHGGQAANASSLCWKTNHVLHGGHKGVVRAWCPLRRNNHDSSTSPVVITAGEDARLCEWNRLGKQLSSSRLLHSYNSCSFSSSTSSFDDGWMIHRRPSNGSSNSSNLHRDRDYSFSCSSSPSPFPLHSTGYHLTKILSTKAAADNGGVGTNTSRAGGGPIRGRNQRRHKQLASPY